MTATERRFAGDSDVVVSMDDPAIYGDTVELLTFKTALDQDPPIIADYKIITMVILQAEIEALVAQNRYLRPDTARWDEEVEAQMLASLIALRKAMQKYPIRHAISFHSSIGRAKVFRDFNDIYTQALPSAGALDTFHVTGAMPAGVRKGIMGDFAKARRALVTNARCLTEGVDVPNIDCVLFSDPKQSTIDIVQAIGRALRPAKAKHCAYVLVPVIMREKTGDAFVESNAFDAVLTVLRALAGNDERIIAWFRGRHAGHRTKGGIVDFDLEEAIGYTIDLDDFAAKIETKVWDRLARLSWRTYDEAVAFVHQLGFERQSDWHAYCRGDMPDLSTKPADIPANPQGVYGEEFRTRGGWGAWLGTANRKGGWRPYDEAVTFVHQLGLKSLTDWRAYCRGERTDLPAKPVDIATSPGGVYGDEFLARGGWGRWLGTGAVATFNRRYRRYDEAVTFVHQFGLKNQADWRAYCRGERTDLPAKPVDIPASPAVVYDDEFRARGGWGAWLGTGSVATFNRHYRRYDEAVAFVQRLGLKRHSDWLAYCRDERTDLPAKPVGIPAGPHVVYGDEFRTRGGWGAWLGTAHRKGGWRPYDEAVEFVHQLGLKGQSDWRAYCRGEKTDLPAKPMDIPADPAKMYGENFRERGGWGAWLGSGRRRRGSAWQAYEEATTFVHALGLKSGSHWKAYCRGERTDLPARPIDVPANPRGVYGDEFRTRGGLGAWLGTGAVATFNRQYRPYDEAVAFVHKLGFKGESDWRAYCRGDRPDLPAKPADIPASPGHVYADEFRERGGWGAWLRTDKRKNGRTNA